MTWLSSFFMGGILAGIYVGPPILLFALALWFKKFLLRNRVSPLKTDLLRPPGYTLQKQIDERQWDLMEVFFMLPLVTTGLPLILLVQAQWFDKQPTMADWIMIGGFLGITIAYYLWKTLKTVRKLGQLRLGYACEMAVGQELMHLIRPQDRPYHVFHDIPFDGFNIDHLAITPSGVFVIETKGRSKMLKSGNKQFKVRLEGDALHFPSHVEKEPIEQTRRNVKSVRKWLCDATGFNVPVAGVLALPGWYIERKQRIVDPYVMNAAELSKELPKLHVGLLEPGQVQAIAHQVAQRVRDVDRNRAG